MTDMTLQDAIADLKQITEAWGEWHVSHFPTAQKSFPTILNVVESGAMVPKADAQLAVARAYRRSAALPVVIIPYSPDSKAAHDAVRGYQAAILALADSDDLAEVAALRAERDSFRAEVARLTGENAELRADYYSAKERLAEYVRAALTTPKGATNAPQEPTEQQ